MIIQQKMNSLPDELILTLTTYLFDEENDKLFFISKYTNKLLFNHGYRREGIISHNVIEINTFLAMNRHTLQNIVIQDVDQLCITEPLPPVVKFVNCNISNITIIMSSCTTEEITVCDYYCPSNIKTRLQKKFPNLNKFSFEQLRYPLIY